MKKILKKIPISKREIIIRIIVVVSTLLLAYHSQDYSKQTMNAISLLFTFIVALYLRKHFFPLFTLAIACWLIATSQELYNDAYTYLTSTKFFWTVGNILIFFGVLDFLYRIIFKYKIIDNEEN